MMRPVDNDDADDVGDVAVTVTLTQIVHAKKRANRIANCMRDAHAQLKQSSAVNATNIQPTNNSNARTRL